MTGEALSDELVRDLVEDVRAAARAEILPRFRALGPEQIATKGHAADLVTEADRAAERRLAEALARRLPGAHVVGEEAAFDDPALVDGLATADLSAVLDPLDGTWNFTHGLGLFGVILAVLRRGRTVFGLLYDPLGDDWVEASAGGGAWFVRSGRPPMRLALGPAPPMAEMTGLVPPDLAPPWDRALAGVGRVLSLRCSCHEYRMLAQGAAQFGLAAALTPWDHAAGLLVHREAGGHAALLDGRPWHPGARGPLLAAPDRASWQALAARFAPLAGTAGDQPSSAPVSM